MRSWIPFIIYSLLSLIILGHFWPRYPHLGQKLTITTLLIYLVAVFGLCLTPAPFSIASAPKLLFHFHGIPYNIIPFQGFSPEFFLNIVMTLPWGVYLFLINHRLSLGQATLAGLGFSLFIETNQFIGDGLLNLGRLADIDDLITNTLGAIIGFIILTAINRSSSHQFLHYFILN